ncbi:uncharacterized protein LOC136031569 [Artemia franciscana]|uniref:uncharacterized protein LOC136031569 n=1 Tax=Artemia franciscana TaxID=6661 RepID=UPI0032DB1614
MTVGAVKKKGNIPEELLVSKGRIAGTSMFFFNQEPTLVGLSYLAKPSKMVLVLSTCCEGTGITYPIQKPEIIEYYNKAKDGAETFDQLCSSMSTTWKTNRRPMCIFYGLIKLSASTIMPSILQYLQIW